MEQLIGYQGHTLQWNLPDDTNKLCHHCGKLGCAPNQCPLRQQWGRTCNRNPMTALKERFHSKTNIPNNQHSRSKSNDKRDHSVSFSSAFRTPPSSSARTQTPSLSSQDASEILFLLKALQQDMADVRSRITALELNDQRMARIKWHIGLQPLSSVSPNTTQTSDMNIDHLDVSNPFLTQNSLRAKPSSRPLNPLLPDFVPLTSSVIPARTSSSAVITSAPTIPSPQHASAEIQAINEKHSAIESKMDMLVASIGSFIGSINTSSTSNSANTASSQ
ncbi:hypothetical protein RclHR1_24170003 [Rhizophagus clarus]|uniref:Uncharacterized protein n=1 Tax=Rhizophagus clarus TaxID=94130 RepID=A0A2Z6QYW0_9GLOM|nr:hypothetical protein RclHR1_24170003 [Rhizophagus clarus]